MKLTKEHIGKRVRSDDLDGIYAWDKSPTITVLYVGKELFFGEDSRGVESPWSLSCNWQLVEDLKKPSEEIDEIAKSDGADYFAPWLKQCCAIKSYLDRLHAQGKI